MNKYWTRLAVPAIALAFAHGAFADKEGAMPTATKSMEEHESQMELTVTVMDRLNADETLAESGIKAEISEEGSVLLKGTVKDDSARQRAEEIVSAIAGVNQVHNDLQVPQQ